MAGKGQFLEIMMANLQSYLGPEGVEVTLRERFYSQQSRKQIGEIDITVRGDFGTSKFFWGIECRDRPADGPQGLRWIREIVGIICLILQITLIGWIPAALWAVYALSQYTTDQKIEEAELDRE